MQILIRLLIVLVNMVGLTLTILTGIPEIIFYTFRYLAIGKKFEEHPYFIRLTVIMQIEIENRYLSESKKNLESNF